MARSQDVASRTLREAFKWLLVPYQEARQGQGVTEVAWEALSIQPNANDAMVEISNKLREDGLLITTWAPVHLNSILNTWFWKKELNDAHALDVWKKTCQYLYLPRLHNQSVYQQAIDAGVRSRDFFGVADGREGEQYQGLALEQNINVILDGTTLPIHLMIAQAYDAVQKQLKAQRDAESQGGSGTTPPSGGNPPINPPLEERQECRYVLLARQIQSHLLSFRLHSKLNVDSSVRYNCQKRRQKWTSQRFMMRF